MHISLMLPSLTASPLCMIPATALNMAKCLCKLQRHAGREVGRMLTKAIANGCVTTEDEHACQSQQAQQPVHHWDVNLPFDLASCRQTQAVFSALVKFAVYIHIHICSQCSCVRKIAQNVARHDPAVTLAFVLCGVHVRRAGMPQDGGCCNYL